jgi:hypothetical protein
VWIRTILLGLAQVTATVFSVGASTAALVQFPALGPLYLIVLMGVPLAVAIFTSNSVKMGAIMAYGLLFCSFGTAVATEAMLGVGF